MAASSLAPEVARSRSFFLIASAFSGNIRGTYASNAWGLYSYVDAFAPLTDWFGPEVCGIDLGVTMVKAENPRTGLVWNAFMKNSEARNAMSKVGLHRA